MSPEDRFSLYIDALNQGRRPPSCEGDAEWELLLETVRRVRRLAPPTMPEPDFPQRLAVALSRELGGRRAGARWGLRKISAFLGTAAAVLVLCFGSYGYGRWSVEGRWPWWPPFAAEVAQGRAGVEQEASQGPCPSAPAAGMDDRARASEQCKEAPLVAADRANAGPATKREEPAAPVPEGPSVAGAPADRGGGGTVEGGPAPGNGTPAAPAGAAPEKTQGYLTASRAGVEEARRPNEVPETDGAPAQTPAPPAKGTPAAGTGITLLFEGREYLAVEVVEAGALATTTLELLGEGRARGLPDGERFPVYRRPDAVPTEVYTPLGEFWVRWAPAEPPARETPTRGRVNGGP